MPPPRVIIEIADNTRSVVGNAAAFFNGIVSPFFNNSGDGLGGEANSTCCEPSRLVWPIFAVAFFGSLTLESMSRVGVGPQFSGCSGLPGPHPHAQQPPG